MEGIFKAITLLERILSKTKNLLFEVAAERLGIYLQLGKD